MCTTTCHNYTTHRVACTCKLLWAQLSHVRSNLLHFWMKLQFYWLWNLDWWLYTMSSAKQLKISSYFSIGATASPLSHKSPNIPEIMPSKRRSASSAKDVGTVLVSQILLLILNCYSYNITRVSAWVTNKDNLSPRYNENAIQQPTWQSSCNCNSQSRLQCN